MTAVHGPSGKLLLYPGNGHGGFLSSRVVGQGWGNFVNLTSFGDVDGDGIPDIVGQRADGNLYRYSGMSDGTWSYAVKIGHGWQTMSLPGPWRATNAAGPPAPKPQTLRQPFVYGTLRTGDEGYFMIDGRVLSEHKATVPDYQLWVTHGGTWPWAIKADAAYPLVGQIMEFPASTLARNLARLDVYEGYFPDRDIDTMRYWRVPTTTTDGKPVWIYETTPRQARWVLRHGYQVFNGDWFRQVRTFSHTSSDAGPFGVAQTEAEVGTADGVLPLNEAALGTASTSDLGTLDGGQFLQLDITVNAPHGTREGYISVPPESFVAVDSQGEPLSPFDEEAKFCSATHDQLPSFVDDGTTAAGTLTFSGDVAQLFWINDDGAAQLIWNARTGS